MVLRLIYKSTQINA